MKKIISTLTAAAMLSAGLTALTAVPAAAETENLLSNGDFESGDLWTSQDWKYPYTGGWYLDVNKDAQHTEVWRKPDYYKSKSYSAKVYNGAIGQLITLDEGNYTLTAYVLSWGENGNIGLYSLDGSGYVSTGVSTKNIPNTNGDWQQISVDIECASNANYVVRVNTWDGTTVYVDDISLTKNEAANPITNADFSDNTNGWTLSGDAASVSGGALTISGSSYTQTVSQTVTGLTAGTYDLTLDVTNSDITGTYYAYAKTAGHTTAMTALPQASTAMAVTVPGIVTDNGTIEIGVYAAGSSTVTLDNFSLSASAASRLPFLKGGEISKLTYVEDNGGKFYRADGTEGDALQIMAENGFNLARIRVLNDPGKGHGDGTYYLPADYQTLDDCITLAKRAMAKGMQIELTIAYSDYWNDGGAQIIPHKWQEEMTASGITLTQDKVTYLTDKVSKYTTEVLNELKNNGITPDYISIGNEIQSGMFFGTDTNKETNPLYYKSDYLKQYINAGSHAAKAVFPDAKVVIHTDNGGKVFEWLTSSWDNTAFQYLLKNADYDVMAVSYYPYYNANISIDDVVSEFNTCISTFNKDVMIMESGYNFAENRSDGYEGQLKDNGYYQNSYGESIDGQRAFLTELYNKMKQVSGGRCIGVSYWDPVMITDNVGWAIEENGDYLQGNVISNSTIFDFTGKAVDGQLAMKYNTNSSDKLLITGRLTKDDKPFANGSTVLSINGTSYTVTSDAYGDYIAAVPYPESGSFTIAAENFQNTYTEDAPTDGILVSGINFTMKPEAQLEEAIWSTTDNSYSVNGNKLTRGDDTLYGYMATLKGNGYIYDTIKVDAARADGENNINKVFPGAKLDTTGYVTFYILTNAELNTESSRIYCE